MMNKLTIEMKYKKSTKNTHVFESTDDNDPIPTLYIKRDAFTDNVDLPKVLKVTISE